MSLSGGDAEELRVEAIYTVEIPPQKQTGFQCFAGAWPAPFWNLSNPGPSLGEKPPIRSGGFRSTGEAATHTDDRNRLGHEQMESRPGFGTRALSGHSQTRCAQGRLGAISRHWSGLPPSAHAKRHFQKAVAAHSAQSLLPCQTPESPGWARTNAWRGPALRPARHRDDGLSEGQER